MKSTILIYVIVSCVVGANFIDRISCKFINRNSTPDQSSLTLLTKQNDSLISETHLRIIDGDFVKIEDYPWIVALFYKNQFFCGGTIISPTRILTAGHCTEGTTRELTIRAGSSQRGMEGQLVAVSKSVTHPTYDTVSMSDDIAILILSSELKMSAEVAVISLPKHGQPIADGTNVTVAGWGRTYNGSLPDFLMGANVRVIANNRCKKIYKQFPIVESMLCAGIDAGVGMGACKGDSGGPLSADRTLIGLVSFGKKGCSAPQVYTRVASYVGWIKKHL